MFFEKALSRRLIFVTGKGGVGKSTVAAALAKQFASHHNRTALVELTTDNTLSRHLSLKPSFDPINEVSPHLSLHNVQPKEILEEFISGKFHFKSIYKTFFDNRFVNYFLEATPGFSEFLIMSKLQNLSEHDLTPFDTVIVDAPATGHALALLEVPHIITEAIHSGPLKHLAAKSLDLITDPEKTGIVIVSTPEEMPATESILIKDEATKLGIETLGLVINKVTPLFKKSYDTKSIPTKHLSIIKKYINDAQMINKNQRTHLSLLKKKFGKTIANVPQIKELEESKISDAVGEILAKDEARKK